ncbi:MAG TPA: DUF305 domain-containing protein [Nocardioides sp.]|uniref:DUF305 domain-containing protein n=1 Tax=uncultured Nocardioides sp. TaxID=198441 RepID=UPI00263036AD|nr:DUF305 domain-containing protein [uncultured Nocardioides sp.]HRD59642.1 DUF305 domain-containing protein [Nocardioides sp.]HRI94391.1 DUF305 domain-containing protein [Nocardioides sp.]
MHARHATRCIAVGIATVALSLGLVACGDDSDSDTASQSSDSQTASNGDVFNDADVTFATDMIPHHAQAIQMVTLTDGRTLDPEVQQLATEIRDAQAPEVETMVDWLTAWGKEVPETSLDHTNAGHDMSEMPEIEGMDDMPGMMSAEDMQALADAPDAEFQTMWLEMMKEHHEGAIEMAQTEQDAGKFADALSLAESIVTAQEAEIEQIDQLLGS